MTETLRQQLEKKKQIQPTLSTVSAERVMLTPMELDRDIRNKNHISMIATYRELKALPNRTVAIDFITRYAKSRKDFDLYYNLLNGDKSL